MVKLYALPLRYERNLEGFTFESIEEYTAKMRHAERFEDENLTVALSFIEGEAIDREVFEAFKVNQDSIEEYFEFVKETPFGDKIKFIIGVKELAYEVCDYKNVHQWSIDIHDFSHFEDFAYDMIERGVFGKVSMELEKYIDYQKLAQSLQQKYNQMVIFKVNYVYKVSIVE